MELPEYGLPLVMRCLAAWWRVMGDRHLGGLPPAVCAAAVAAVVARRAGFDRTRKAAAHDHGADPEEVRAAARRLQTLLALSDTRSW